MKFSVCFGAIVFLLYIVFCYLGHSLFNVTGELHGILGVLLVQKKLQLPLRHFLRETVLLLDVTDLEEANKSAGFWVK